MSHGGVRYVGDWKPGEQNIVARTVAATDEFLDADMPAPWVFTKGESGFSVTQPSLFEKEMAAPKLGDLLEQIRNSVSKASMWVTYGE